MAIHDYTADNEEFHRNTILSLEENSERAFGIMTPAQMMRHLRISTEMALEGRPEAKRIVPPVLSSVMGFVFFDVFTTWPGGRFKGPAQFNPKEVDSLEEERVALLAALKQFLEQSEKKPGMRRMNPALGRITMTRWAHFLGVHMNHHYRQFNLVS